MNGEDHYWLIFIFEGNSWGRDPSLKLTIKMENPEDEVNIRYPNSRTLRRILFDRLTKTLPFTFQGKSYSQAHIETKIDKEKYQVLFLITNPEIISSEKIKKLKDLSWHDLFEEILPIYIAKNLSKK